MTGIARERAKSIAGPVLVGTVAVALALRTWRMWGNPVVDFGRELYVAWRLSEGALLYRDVAHFNGPLSGYVNAAWFAAMGPGLVQLIALNLLVLSVITAVLFVICRSVADRLTATVAAIVFLSLQGFGYFGLGIFNFVTPYSHELTHGLLLGLLAVAAVRAYACSGKSWWAFVAGVCVGLAFLTKPETFVGAFLAAGVGLAGAWYWARTAGAGASRRSRGWRSSVLAALGGAVIPPVVAFAALSMWLGPTEAADGLLHQWRMVADPRITGLLFYRRVAGLDAIGSNLSNLGVWTLSCAAGLLVLVRSSKRLRVGLEGRVIAFAATVMAILATGLWVPWHRVWFVLPAGVTVVLVDSASRVARHEGDAGEEVAMLAFGMLALALLAKQGLFPRVSHYGFALAVPAVAVCVVALMGRIPRRLTAGAGVFRSAALGLIASITLFHLGISSAYIDIANGSRERIGVARDALWTDSLRARVLDTVIRRVQKEPEGTTLAVLPEGAYVDFVLRRQNPTPFVQLAPPELITWGEDTVVAAYRRSPPDEVVLVQRNYGQYGSESFETLAPNLMEWLRDNYRSEQVVGDRPFTDGAVFGAEIFERKPATTSHTSRRGQGDGDSVASARPRGLRWAAPVASH